MEDIDKGRLAKKKVRLEEKVEQFDRKLLTSQEKTADKYANYFSLNISLLFMLLSGAAFTFIGRDCYGMIPLDSPAVVFILIFSVFILFQTYITIPLNTLRILKLVGVFYFAYSLTSQLWGLYSVEYLADIKNACKPTLYFNSVQGGIRAILPDIIIIIICFKGNRDEQT